MLIDDGRIGRKIARIAAGIARDPSWRDDLVQEARIHLWQIEFREPGHTSSWYLQSCSFHLRKLVKAGRSLDAPKRSALRQRLPDDGDGPGAVVPTPLVERPGAESVSLEDFIHQLSQRLPALERGILRRLIAGESASEVARALGVSHTSVARHRRTIGLVARGLGLTGRSRGAAASLAP